MNSSDSTRKTVARSTFIVTIIVLIVVIIGTGAYALYSVSTNQSTISSLQKEISSQQSQLVTQQSVISSNQPLALAMSHWNNIAIENATLITSEYTPNAQLFWEGGPLTGNYTGVSVINSTWTKFSHAYEYVTWYAVSAPKVSVNGTSAVVQAPIQFVVFPSPTNASPNPKSIVLSVNETLTYTYSTSSATWMLNTEVWKVALLQISAVAPGYTSSNYTG